MCIGTGRLHWLEFDWKKFANIVIEKRLNKHLVSRLHSLEFIQKSKPLFQTIFKISSFFKVKFTISNQGK